MGTVTDDSQGAPLAMMQDLAGAGRPTTTAQVRGEAERAAAFRNRDNGLDIVHSRPLPAHRCATADRHPRMAWLGHRAAEDHRAAHQSRGARRERCGRVPSGDSSLPGYGFSAKPTATGSDPARIAVLGRADAAPRIHPVRGAGRRLGRGLAKRCWDRRSGAARQPLRAGPVPLQPPSIGGPAGDPTPPGLSAEEIAFRSAEQHRCQALRFRADPCHSPADAVPARVPVIALRSRPPRLCRNRVRPRRGPPRAVSLLNSRVAGSRPDPGGDKHHQPGELTVGTAP